MNRKIEWTIFIWNKYNEIWNKSFFNIINIFTITFDEFKALKCNLIV